MSRYKMRFKNQGIHKADRKEVPKLNTKPDPKNHRAVNENKLHFPLEIKALQASCSEAKEDKNNLELQSHCTYSVLI